MMPRPVAKEGAIGGHAPLKVECSSLNSRKKKKEWEEEEKKEEELKNRKKKKKKTREIILSL